MRARAGAVLAAFHEGAGAGIHEGVHEGAMKWQEMTRKRKTEKSPKSILFFSGALSCTGRKGGVSPIRRKPEKPLKSAVNHQTIAYLER